MDEEYNLSTAIHHWQNCLLVSLPENLNEKLILAIRQATLIELSKKKYPAVLLDFSVVIITDENSIRQCEAIAKLVQLMGSRLLCLGFSPALASIIIDLPGKEVQLETVRDIGAALKLVTKPSQN